MAFCLERSTSSSDAASDRLDGAAAHPNYLPLMDQSIKRHSERERERQKERTLGPVVELVSVWLGDLS